MSAYRGRPKRVPTFWPDFDWREEDVAVPVVESDIDRFVVECPTWEAAVALAKDLTEGRATWRKMPRVVHVSVTVEFVP